MIATCSCVACGAVWWNRVESEGSTAVRCPACGQQQTFVFGPPVSAEESAELMRRVNGRLTIPLKEDELDHAYFGDVLPPGLRN